jgi:hydrogenase expression/formation protein HypE
VDPAVWTCPLPLRDSPAVTLGHGGGGELSAELLRYLFLPAFSSAAAPTELAELGDSAVVELAGARLAFSTDGYVVRPLFFPGGCIGDLAVHGTVNDLAMSGAVPAVLSCAVVLEEGTAMETVGRIAAAMGRAAAAAGIRIVAGDTKVVEAGSGDGVYVTTAGIGLVPPGVDIRPQRARPGDVVLVSGEIGLHGVAVLSVREGLNFGTEVVSDTAPLSGLVAAMLAVEPDLHVLRDPTRGGLAATLNEIADASGVGVEVVERAVPVPESVRNACGFLGLDPWYVANEGKLVAFVPRASADAVLAVMRAHPLGASAAVVGECVDAHPGVVVARTAFGATRVVELPLGEQLPRIC